MGKIVLSYAIIEYKEPIVSYSYQAGTELGFPEIKELVRYAETLSGDKPYVTFSDATVPLNLTMEGRRYLSEPSHLPLFRGTAALVKNGMQKFAANFLSAFHKKPYPFKAFTDKEKAIEWLRTLPLQ